MGLPANTGAPAGCAIACATCWRWRSLAPDLVVAVGEEMTGQQASCYLNVQHSIKRSLATFTKLRSIVGGPLFPKAGRDVIYEAADLDAWADQVKSGPLACTSEAR
jgi:hypothetical protein